MSSARERLIVALDQPTVEEARAAVDRLGDSVVFYKIGLTLHFAGGLELARDLARRGKRVFLDAKLYDIPEQVRGAVANIDRMGVDFLTVHGDREIIAAAVAGRAPGSRLRLLAVTVLTSLDDSDLQTMGFMASVEDLVRYRVALAREAGADGVVASGLEAAGIRAQVGDSLLIVSPGIRSAGVGRDEQKRVTTPEDAMRAGVDYIVVGRQILRAADPKTEADKVVAEMERGLGQRG